MRGFFSRLNPTVRGFLLIDSLVALVIVVLQLQATLTALYLVAQIAFLLAIAYFVYLVWRERRSQDIATWPTPRAPGRLLRGRVPIVADIAAYGSGTTGRAAPDALAFFLVLGLRGVRDGPRLARPAPHWA